MSKQYVEIYYDDELQETTQSISKYEIAADYSVVVWTGGTATSTSVSSGGKLTVSGGTATGTTVKNGGTMSVSSGSVANNITVNADGILLLSAEASKISLYGGSLTINEGGVASDVKAYLTSVITVNAGGVLKGKITKTSQGNVYSSVLEQNGTINLSGGTVNTLKIGNGTLIVGSGSLATAVYQEKNGSTVQVLSNGKIDGLQCDGAVVTVAAGGTASNSELNSYTGEGFEVIQTFTASMTLSSGASHTGTLTIDSKSTLKAESGSIIDFTVSACNPDNTALISDLSRISGTPSYTLTVKDDQQAGTYCLAQGASAFAQNITLKNTEETILGTLSSGKTITVNDTKYTLNNDDSGNLTLTVESEKLIRRASSDVDGNGISDVVFQWTGGDYQIGFWMNGTNNWQGQGIGQPSDWELIGAYDMDQNGKADLVMRGNIQIGEDKGAYIGYYKDGDVTQWQNISFLNNPDDIDWKLAIGNVTGNADCNSIVWHAPELGALGVWTDGTANWVSLAGGFDSNWTMLGCGDFDGNGKDEVLFSHAGDLYTTDIDQNFASLGGWGVEWEVKAIGDFAGDGKDDIIVQNGNIIAKFKDGKAENWESVGVMDSSDWFICGTGDYNGDQQDDLLVRQYSTGMLGYYESGDMSKWVEMGRGVDMNWSVIA